MKNIQIPCKKCGTDIVATDKFCSHCGEKNTYNAGEVQNLISHSLEPEHKELLNTLEAAIKSKAPSANVESETKSKQIDTVVDADKAEERKVKKSPTRALTPEEELREKVSQHNDSTLVWSIGMLLVGAAICSSAWFIFDADLHDNILLGIFGLVLGCVGFGVIGGAGAILLSDKCSNCGAKDAVSEDESRSDKLIDRSNGYETVTRQQKNRDGDVVREYQEQVRVQRSVYHVHYKCVVCGAKSIGTRKDKTHDFNN